MIGIMYQCNTASFTTIISSIAGDLIPKGRFNPANIGWLISIPSLLMIVGVLLNAWAVRKWSMRNVMIIGWVVFGLAGMAIYWCPSENSILAMRALQGLGIGLAQPSTKALPARMYGGASRAKILGWISCGGGILSMIVSVVFGNIGELGWRYTMFFYPAWALITIILAVIFVPSLPPEEKVAGTAAAKGDRRPYGSAVWCMVIFGLLLYALSSVIQIKTSIRVTELNLGGSASSGYVSACNTIGIILGGFVFGWVYNKCQRWTLVVGMVIVVIGYFWFSFSSSLVGLMIAGAVGCFGVIGICIPYMFTRISFLAPAERRSNAILILTFTTYIGQVLTTPWVNLVAQITGTGDAATALIWTSWGYVVLLVIALVYIIATRKTKLTAAEKYGRE